MGVHTLIGTADGTTPAAAMYDSGTDVMFGPLFRDDDHGEAADQIDGFLNWLRLMPYAIHAEAIDLTSDDLPRPPRDGVDARDWPESGLRKLVAYYLANEWTGGDDGE